MGFCLVTIPSSVQFKYCIHKYKLQSHRTITYTYKDGYIYGQAKLRPAVHLPSLLDTGSVPDSKSRNIPEVVIVRRGAVGVLGIWKGWDGWVKGGVNGVSLQAT
jgi:hypothetical protein